MSVGYVSSEIYCLASTDRARLWREGLMERTVMLCFLPAAFGLLFSSAPPRATVPRLSLEPPDEGVPPPPPRPTGTGKKIGDGVRTSNC